MKSFTILRAAAFRGLKPQLFETVAPLELIEGIKRKYEFLKFPTLERANDPFDFHVGKLKHNGRVLKIDQLVVSYIGTEATSIGAASRTSSNDADVFLDDLIDWLAKEFELDVNTRFSSAYHSQAEFVFSEKAQLSDHFKELSELGKGITNIIRGYGSTKCPEFELNTLAMHFDLSDTTLPKPIATPFSFERRVGTSYGENKYFSQAPLKTQDHKAVLEQLEKILMAR
jgi:hypothetical protein